MNLILLIKKYSSILSFFILFFAILNSLILQNILLFASGSGTNAENSIKYFKDNPSASVVAVFTNNPNAQVIERAKNLEVQTEIFSKTELYELDFLEKINSFKPDLIVLAGFLLQFPESIIRSYPNKIINIHPALLPKYGGKGMYGMHVHRAVVENKENESGITIHYVNENYDEGAIIFQEKVSLLPIDTPEMVAAKIHELEQKYFPKVIEEILNLKS